MLAADIYSIVIELFLRSFIYDPALCSFGDCPVKAALGAPNGESALFIDLFKESFAFCYFYSFFNFAS